MRAIVLALAVGTAACVPDLDRLHAERANEADAADGGSLPAADASALDAAGMRCTLASFAMDSAGLVEFDPAVVGTAPTLAVVAGELRITDATTAKTPSNPLAGYSWIVDLAKDRGNQMGWRRAPVLGTRDFAVDVTFSWSSAKSEATLAGLVLTGGDDRIFALVGVRDESTEDVVLGGKTVPVVGKPFVVLQGKTTVDPDWIDDAYQRAATVSGEARVLVRRTGGQLVVEEVRGGVSLVRVGPVAFPHALAKIGVASVRVQNLSIPFGEFGLRRLEACVAE